MKNFDWNRYARIFCGCLMGFLVALTATLVFNVDAQGAAFAAAATGAPVSDIKETSTPDEHKVRDVSDALAVLEPSRFPLDTMMRKLQGRRQGGVENVKIEWARSDRIPRTDEIASGSAAGADGAAVDWTVKNGNRWRKNDLISIPGDLTAPVMLVEEVKDASAGTITVRALVDEVESGGDSFGTVPATSADDPLARIGNSKTESDEPSESRAMMPEYDWNLVHTYDAVVEISDHRRRTSNHTMTDDWKRARQDNLIDLRRSFEFNGFFGVASESTAQNAEERYTQNGVTRYIPNTINYTIGGMSEASLIDINKTIFTGNDGAFTRMLFADAELCTELDKVLLSKMQTAPSRTIAGVTFSELKTRFGRLMVAYHPGFEELGYTNFGVVLDMNNIYKREMQPMEKQKLMLKETGIRDAEAEQYIEKSSLEVRRPDTHYIIRGS